jgi:hypothetical protein
METFIIGNERTPQARLADEPMVDGKTLRATLETHEPPGEERGDLPAPRMDHRLLPHSPSFGLPRRTDPTSGKRLLRDQSSISGATSCKPWMEIAMNSSKGSPIFASTSATSSRFTPGANDFSLSFFLTLETFMPADRSGRTSAAATRRPATASAFTTAFDIRSVRYSS